jgi:hypothetical protein
MPFGQHKGKPIDQVDPSYLIWALQHTNLCNPAHPNYRPELRAVFESIVGPVAWVSSPDGNGDIDSLSRLCSRMAAAGVRISLTGGKVVIHDADSVDKSIRDSIEKHREPLAKLLSCSLGTRSGSVKLQWIGELRGRLKGLYNRMTRRHHPDLAGGSDAAQAVVNEYHKAMMAILEELGNNP